ncbi:MAG TPA: DNA polymerase III subunit gamma/tau [Bryobacteraceae bacterium]|jgi:DNA polymerase-3 subunit gamma/tau|nr:DNA polymerase III subunit gamma/tau [Bryobacteraceae bacterium]
MYQVIARKYRPQSFGELIGQEHVQRTLSNAIASNRVAHGYIFSGQRGTGKTTVARILARCLNCVQGPTPTPCNVCSSCVEITAGNSVDVLEIDAASNRGINEMREIRENVRYRPARDRYKIFIIDEAHQITKEAFNALLKTLEEPPEWVVFILCTTEAHEIPNTIASRCQHFSFRSVDFAELMNRMRYIVQQEHIDASEEVLSVIALAGEGSVRDSLSALDQAIACCGKTLHEDDVRALLGMFGAEPLRGVAEAVLKQDGARMLQTVQELERKGQSLQHFCRELARYWRNLLVAKIAGQPSRLIAAPDPEQQRLLETANLFSEEDLTRYLSLTLELYKTLQESLQPRLHLELGLVKLVQAGKLQSIEQAIADLGKPQAAPMVARAAASSSPPPIEAGPTVARVAASSSPPPSVEARPPAETPASVPTLPPKAGDLRQELHDALSKAGMTFSADAIRNAEVSLGNGELLVRVPKSMTLAVKDSAVQRVAAQVVGKPVRVRVEVAENLAAGASPEPIRNAVGGDTGLRERALSHPGVKRFQEVFPDAQVRTVRNLNE